MTNKNIPKQITGILIPILVLVGAVMLAVWFVKTKPAPQKQNNKTMASAVKTVTVSYGSQQVMVSAMGTVAPIEDITLQPEVTGLVIWKSPNLVPGGIINEGEKLLAIDPRNYEAARKQHLASREKARVEYQIEMSRSEVAAEEWRMMGAGSMELGVGSTEVYDKNTLSRTKSLALREPQLRAAKIAVLAASNLLEKATIDVERTEIRAPFNAVVINEFVDRGQLVSPQSHLAQLAGTDAFRVEAALPVRDLQWIKHPDNNGQNGSKVTVVYDTGASDPVQFKGKLTQILSSLDNITKMVKVMVRVDDPLMLAKQQTNNSKTGLLAGAYVKVLIEGITLDKVIELPGTLIHEGNKSWVMNSESQLEIRDVDVIWRQDGRALIKSGISEGEKIISSHISNPIPRMMLKQNGNKVTQGDKVKGKAGRISPSKPSALQQTQPEAKKNKRPTSNINLSADHRPTAQKTRDQRPATNRPADQQTKDKQ